MRDETSPKWQIMWAQTRYRKNHRKTAHWSTNSRFRSLFSSCPFYGQHRTRSSRTHHQKKRYAIRKAREAFLISKGKTLETHWFKKDVRKFDLFIYLFFIFLFISVLVHIDIFLYFCLPITSLIFSSSRCCLYKWSLHYSLPSSSCENRIQ